MMVLLIAKTQPSRIKEACTFEPPNPSALATPLDPTNLIDFSDSIKFLYEGDNPIIRGLDPSALELENLASTERCLCACTQILGNNAKAII